VKHLVFFVAAASLLVTLTAACGSTHRTAAGCHVSRTCPSTNGSYAWRPLQGASALVCFTASGDVPRAFDHFVDYRGRFYDCKLPAPVDRRTQAGLDFFGPTTIAEGSVPLKPHQLRITVDVSTRRPALLKVEYGDGTSWQRTVRGDRTFNLVHSYARTRSSYFLASLRDKVGYLGITGEGPFRGPPPGPRPRYCAYEATGKGGRLSATTSLTCSEAQRLFGALSPRGKLRGYRCRERGLPPSWSDTGVITCTSGPRTFVFTSNA